MTATILSHGAQLHPTLPPIDQMPEAFDDAWRRSHYHSMSIAMNQYWPQSHGPVGDVLNDPDLRMFHGDAQYDHTFHHDAGSLISPTMAYLPDTNFGSDMDVGTPSTSGFPEITADGYHHMRTSHLHSQTLHPLRALEHSASAQSPQSSISGVSPHLNCAQLVDAVIVHEERPGISRSITAPAAPEQLRARKQASAGPVPSATPSIKRSGSEEDEDDDYIPTEEVKTRGRKRQRIPHTAVERRYRENLNAHLDKLRQTIPALASKKTKPGDGACEGGVKPSKCEVLNGAIEHIHALNKDNSSLRIEVKTLRGRLDDLERWFATAQAQGRV